MALALLFGPALSARAADPLDIGLEELLAAEVTGASRKPQQLRDVAAAVFVLNREDIARSGATSIPDILRLVPGVQVAQVANGRWAVSARGFNGRFANKLQVLMDGRSLYSPLFAGVLWEAEDTLIEDIERIEVIRGPGAAQWGANAVNGVINIVTRRARDTVGELVSATAGTDRTELGVRHGGIAGSGHYRLFAKGLSNPSSPAAGGGEANDERRAARMGYRGDWLSDSGKQLSVIGGAYTNSMDGRFLLVESGPPIGIVPTDHVQRNRGAHLLARQQIPLSDGSRLSIQGYLETSRITLTDFITDRRTTADLEFEHHLRFGDRHDVVWGGEHRRWRDRIETTGVISVAPERETTRLNSLFIHDEITIFPDRFNLALGVRIDDSEISGLETQPSIRAMWKPSSTESVWASAARASRLISRGESDVTVELAVTPPQPPSPFPQLIRNIAPARGAVQSEVVDAIEVGYRSVWHDKASFDVTAFRNRYHDLRASVFDSAVPAGGTLVTPPTHLVVSLLPTNAVEARSLGFELSGDIQVASWWRLHPAWTWLRVEAWAPSGDTNAGAVAKGFENESARHRLSLRSSMNLGKKQQLDLVARYVGGSSDVRERAIRSYTAFDVRYALRPADRLELALVGRNLGPKRHPEVNSDLMPAEATEVERSFFATAKWEF